CQNEISLQQEALISIYTDLLKGISKVALLGFPDHSNKGDSAIWVGERILLEALGIEVVYIARTLSDFNATEMARILQVTPSEGTTTKISKSRKDFVESAILFHGGGNFGDLYWTHQELRNSVVNGFPQIRIVSFPQTVHFSSSSSPALAKVIEAYRLHNHLTIVARDVQSFNFLAKHLGTHQIRLAPDVAFMIGSVAGRISTVPQDEAASSTKSKQLHQKWDVLVHQRSDKESTPDQRSRAAWETLRFDGVSSTFSFKIDDWLGTANSKYGWIPDLNKRAYRRLEDGLDFLAQGRLVITNRLHGHILLTLMGVPHIVLDNLHSKVLNYYSAWTKSCGL
ncbi:polysaccharide pyruvyl transferase, partial [Zopfochytrium polystomum]